MPRTNLAKPKYPPVNKLRAYILEREMVAGYSHKDLADIANVNYSYMRKLINQVDPWDWPRDVRQKVCRALEIKTTLIVDDSSSDAEDF